MPTFNNQFQVLRNIHSYIITLVIPCIVMKTIIHVSNEFYDLSINQETRKAGCCRLEKEGSQGRKMVDLTTDCGSVGQWVYHRTRL